MDVRPARSGFRDALSVVQRTRIQMTTRQRAAAFGLAALAIVSVPAPSGTPVPAERTVRVEARRFSYTPAIIAVNPGDSVTIELVAGDVVHGLYIDGYDLSISADPGRTERLTFVADRPGTFRIHCAVPCGPLHPFMIGKLKVGSNRLLWRAVGLAVLAAFAGVVANRK